jgi:hypothetical protein
MTKIQPWNNHAGNAIVGLSVLMANPERYRARDGLRVMELSSIRKLKLCRPETR